MYDRFGERDLLRKVAAPKLAEIVRANDHEVSLVREITNKRFRKLEGIVIALWTPADPFTTVELPFCAKAETITFKQEPWYSVSETILAAVPEFNEILTYLDDKKDVFVSDRRNNRPDQVFGPYLRLGERYFGWKLADVVSLAAWLKDRSSLKVQGTLNGGTGHL